MLVRPVRRDAIDIGQHQAEGDERNDDSGKKNGAFHDCLPVGSAKLERPDAVSLR